MSTINFNNGFYNFKTNTFNKYSDDTISSLNVGYDYIEYSGDEPIFNEINIYFNKLLKNEEECSKMISNLSNIVKEIIYPQRANIIYGLASNDKTTFINMIKKLFGEYYSSIEQSDEEIDLTPYCDKRIIVADYQLNPFQKFKPFNEISLYLTPNPPIPKFQIFYISNIKLEIPDDAKRLINIFNTTFTNQEQADFKIEKKIETPEWNSALMWMLIHKY